MWNPNRAGRGIDKISRWWPGDRHTDLAGLDGYFHTPQATFCRLYCLTLRAVRRLTREPVLIAETAVAPGPTARAQITSLFAGMRNWHLVGVVWFDINAKLRWEFTPGTARAYIRAAPAPRRSR
jgi:hypothetical protein